MMIKELTFVRDEQCRTRKDAILEPFLEKWRYRVIPKSARHAGHAEKASHVFGPTKQFARVCSPTWMAWEWGGRNPMPVQCWSVPRCSGAAVAWQASFCRCP